LKILHFIKQSLALLLASMFVCCLTSVGYAKKNVRVIKDKRAELVIDVQSGRVLYSYKSDHMRHPASLTKLMTLYMLFEQIDNNRLSPYSKIKISRNAARKPPSKLGLKAGSTITVRDAAYTLIIKSANDIATAVAEKIGGSEKKFARMMTQKARKLGMTRTVFRNASGLPDRKQVTTARDMAVLGMRIMKNFPHYYKYFATKSKRVAGRNLRTHNHLLKSYPGMDGMKTGFINMSGFNLVSSAQRNNKRLLTVVFGGRTYRVRDKRVAKLTDLGWQRLKKPRGYRQFLGVSVRKLSSLKSSFKPLENKNFAHNQHASLAGIKKRDNKIVSVERVKPSRKTNAFAEYSLKEVVPASRGGWHGIGKLSKKNYVANKQHSELIDIINKANEIKETKTSKKILLSKANVKKKVKAITEAKAQKNVLKQDNNVYQSNDKIPTYQNWTIQVGAFSKKDAADEYLTVLMQEHHKLSKSQPELVAIKKGDAYIYRARFKGFSASKAKQACQSLKKSGRHCITKSDL